MKFGVAVCLFLCAQLCQASNWLPQDLDKGAKREQSERFGSGKLMQVERGQVDGSGYTIWADGRGEVAHWQLKCTVDAMTDVKSCLVSSGDLWILVASGAVVAVTVGDSHSPGSEVAIRVDQAPAQISRPRGWAGADARALVNQLASGTAARTRFQRWPEQATTEGQTVLGGLKGAINTARSMTRAAK